MVVPLTAEIAALTAYLPADFPSDPADRAIAATAQAYGISLVTADERIQASPLVKTIW
jgi:PIN domain nuclease of toxin-antitoxin system